MFSKTSDLFTFERCSFKIQKRKKGTGRVAVRTTYDILNSFTLECSFSGSDKGLFHYSVGHLEILGAEFGKSIYSYFLVEYGNLNEKFIIETSAKDIIFPKAELCAVKKAIQNEELIFLESDE